MSLTSGLLSQADIAAVAVSCRRLKSVAGDALYTHNRDRNRSSAVLWAAKCGNIATLYKAFKHGLVIDDTKLPWTAECGPFQIAVTHGQDSAVAWLLDHGADLTRRVPPHCCGRRTLIDETCILHTAFCLGHASTAQLLISRGAPLEYTSHLPFSPDLCTTTALLEASSNGFDAIVEILAKDYGMGLQRVGGPWYRDALSCAAMSDENVSTIRTLVGLGANVNGLHSDWDSSPLHAALDEGNFAVAHTLLDLGAGIHSQDYVSVLDLDNKSGENEVGLDAARIYTDVAPLHDTIGSIYKAPTEWIPGRPIKRSPVESWRVERDRVLKRLLGLGLDINEELLGWWGNEYREPSSPLDLATELGDTQDMELLITAGAQVKSEMVYTAWRRSDRDARESTAKMRLLLKHGGRLDEPVQDDSSLLDLAARHADEVQEMSGLHEILLLSSPKSLSGDHLDEVLAECLAECGGYSSTVLVRHGARVSCKDRLFLIACSIADELEPEPKMDNVDDFDDETVLNPDYAAHTCLNFIIDMGLSSEDQCLLFPDILSKRLLSLAHLFLDRGLASRPEAADFLSACLMLTASWGNVSVIKRLWRYAQDVPDATLRYSIVQQSIIPGNREAVSFFMEHGATAFQHLTPSEASRGLEMHSDTLKVQRAALERFNSSSETSWDDPSELRELRRMQFLTARYDVLQHSGIYMRPFLSPFQLAVRYNHVDIISDLLEYVTPSHADAINACGNIYIPCVLSRANEIREMIEKKGIRCGSDQ